MDGKKIHAYVVQTKVILLIGQLISAIIGKD